VEFLWCRRPEAGCLQSLVKVIDLIDAIMDKESHVKIPRISGRRLLIKIAQGKDQHDSGRNLPSPEREEMWKTPPTDSKKIKVYMTSGAPSRSSVRGTTY
jgi:hypothetical protein